MLSKASQFTLLTHLPPAMSRSQFINCPRGRTAFWSSRSSLMPSNSKKIIIYNNNNNNNNDDDDDDDNRFKVAT